MARTTTDKKNDFIGTPVSKEFKDRFKRLAKRKGIGHTVMSRQAMEVYADREEKSLGKQVK